VRGRPTTNTGRGTGAEAICGLAAQQFAHPQPVAQVPGKFGADSGQADE